MFTKEFKYTVGTLAAVAVVGGLAYNQAQLAQKVSMLQNREENVVTIPTPTVLPTETPTATPTATLRSVRVIVPVSREVTTGPTK